MLARRSTSHNLSHTHVILVVFGAVFSQGKFSWRHFGNSSSSVFTNSLILMVTLNLLWSKFKFSPHLSLVWTLKWPLRLSLQCSDVYIIMNHEMIWYSSLSSLYEYCITAAPYLCYRARITAHCCCCCCCCFFFFFWKLIFVLTSVLSCIRRQYTFIDNISNVKLKECTQEKHYPLKKEFQLH